MSFRMQEISLALSKSICSELNPWKMPRGRSEILLLYMTLKEGKKTTNDNQHAAIQIKPLEDNIIPRYWQSRTFSNGQPTRIGA